MKYSIQYEGLYDELVRVSRHEYNGIDSTRHYWFESLKNGANEFEIELSNKEFRLLFDLIRLEYIDGAYTLRSMKDGRTLDEVLARHIMNGPKPFS